MRRILVTGGAGFIGSQFIKYWLSRHPNDLVINLDKFTYAANLESIRNLDRYYPGSYRLVIGDICDPTVVRREMEGVHTVVDFAAETHVDRSLDDPAVFLRTNIDGTRVLLEAALEAKVQRFHYISTDEVFGALSLGAEKFTEDSKLNPRSPYAVSKAAAELLVRAYYFSFGLPITVSNTSNNFGPYQHPEKFIPRAITNVIWGDPIPIYGDGKQVRDWIHVYDHCAALELVLLKGEVGETYLIGADAERQNIEVARKILELMGKSESMIKSVPDRPGHDIRYALDSTRIRTKFAWKPRHPFEEWLQVTVQWYQENESWWAPLKEEAERFYSR